MNKHLFAIKTVPPVPSLVVQWLRLHPSNAQGVGLILVWENRSHILCRHAHTHTHTHTDCMSGSR